MVDEPANCTNTQPESNEISKMVDFTTFKQIQNKLQKQKKAKKPVEEKELSRLEEQLK